jgi:hypothetical protein
MIARWRHSINHTIRSSTRRLRARWSRLPSLGSARIGFLGLCAFILVALIYLAQSSNAALIARDLRVKQLQITEIERENAQLRYEIAALASPSAIEQRARKLGLGPARRVVYAEMPWIQPAPNELMPAFMPQVNRVTTPRTFQVADSTTFEQLLTMLGLETLADHLNAQGW